MVSKYLLLAVIFSGLVTWIPRMIPFILVKYKGLPAIVERFLKFLPVSIIFALILSSVVTGKVGSFPQIKWLDFLAVFPTAWVAFRYRNLVGTALFGVVFLFYKSVCWEKIKFPAIIRKLLHLGASVCIRI